MKLVALNERNTNSTTHIHTHIHRPQAIEAFLYCFLSSTQVLLAFFLLPHLKGEREGGKGERQCLCLYVCVYKKEHKRTDCATFEWHNNRTETKPTLLGRICDVLGRKNC